MWLIKHGGRTRNNRQLEQKKQKFVSRAVSRAKRKLTRFYFEVFQFPFAFFNSFPPHFVVVISNETKEIEKDLHVFFL